MKKNLSKKEGITKKLVPNEDLLNMINQFNKINIDDELNMQDDEKGKEKKDEKIKDVKLYGEPHTQS